MNKTVNPNLKLGCFEKTVTATGIRKPGPGLAINQRCSHALLVRPCKEMNSTTTPIRPFDDDKKLKIDLSFKELESQVEAEYEAVMVSDANIDTAY